MRDLDGARKRRAFQALTLCVLAGLALSLVTMLMLAPYSFPCWDDFVYGTPVNFTLEAGKGLGSVLSAVWENIRYTYMDWQGTFSSVALFSLEPGAFSSDAYGLTAYVMLAAIIASVFLALGAVRGMDRWGRLFLGGVISFYAVQYLPSLAQWIYWWNGAAHYLAFWFLSVAAVAWQLRLLRWEQGRAKLWAGAIFGCALGFCVGGGNFCTALVFPLISILLTGYAVWKRRPRCVWMASGLIALCALAGLAVSVAAPGNGVRQAGFEGLKPVAAVGASFFHAGKTLLGMLDLKLLGALAVCIPVFLYAVRGSGYSFRRPLPVLAGSFCLLAALYTPPLYAMGDAEMAPRLVNLFWLATLFFVFGNAFYWAGWAARRWNLFARGRFGRTMGAVCAAGAVLFSAAVLVSFRSSNAYRAYADLRSPALEAYVREREERTAVYADKSVPTPRFEPLTPAPACFFHTRVITWAPDLLVDGVPQPLPIYRGQGGEVTYVELQTALDFFGAPGAAAPSDFSVAYSVRGGDYVPIRQLCDLLGFRIDYLADRDTITIDTADQ